MTSASFLPKIAYALLATLWLLVTRWMGESGHSSLMTVAWSGIAVAVLAAGIFLRDRAHRLAGLTILALALGRILFYDIWLFEGYRIVNLMVLGIALIALGFIYNRYSHRIRSWIDQP
jgi:uncharacterized membrane protein